MARLILVYGQPAAGKTYALKTLNPDETVIIDGDRKGALCWLGWKKLYNVDRKNFFAASSLDKTIKLVEHVANNDDFKHVKNIVVDGLNNIMSIEDTAFFFGKRPYKNKLDLYEAISQKTIWLIETCKGYRSDLNIIFNAHVKTADPYATGEVDHLFTPGKALENKKKIEGAFNYAFYAKADREGNHFFETAPINSTARTPEGCFPPTIPNDMQFIINTIDKYDEGAE
ncbi:MAG: AAA family ATPase [Selenomonadaceae bacterium]|nr:AAA family ATPase [Selenomonadaceae bacterium]MBR1805891.1 AAA family ATPase [Selenomonadaceae bacterium]